MIVEHHAYVNAVICVYYPAPYIDVMMQCLSGTRRYPPVICKSVEIDAFPLAGTVASQALYRSRPAAPGDPL